ncbi:armadillo-like helical domain-containing protein 3 [Neodiprion pinetum]|uniref:Armadillo-like helical domain-containing protein 3 n=1 Tax=Neodiprion lecontei TaxID=441921 RepID=A0A6J0CCP5_NEOLC|nr:armadillo-like helical domain-containing protein 3 [Neodiprion lecontei]XP_015524467.1 armadillo-like helical domain-containing protein 3 [Neodiprion lecontei]XP_015524468.1 armadillo-like helical domain-containing protein 3 [Neodiprion lecontei]XP_015524469.1 armadillo-like helical domain-containing protein 3 [Neodiprion lecontei]XP_046419395.1 armadillo-like helical domain-containing protein 3 [Neodiprion fabricii]XP_046419396.1 armadillo-like helical domain-containing protein 3 [Neodipri
MTMAMRKRSGSGSKRQYREKILLIYESFFKGDEPTLANPHFWDELFLLKPKVAQIEAEILRLAVDQLSTVRENLNALVCHCVDTLAHEHHIRVVYALQTLSAVIQAMYKKADQGDCGFNLIDNLVGFNSAEQRMTTLMRHCNNFITGEYPDSLKALCLKLLLIIVTGTDNVSQNTLLEYVMLNSVFESLVQLLRDTKTRSQHGHDAVLLLTLLVNYRKHESANPYIVKLSILDDEVALNGYGQVISTSLTDFCRQFDQQRADIQASWLSSLTNMVGSMFVGEEEAKTQQIRANNALLLALYEATHLNRYFVTTLAHIQSDTSAPPSPNNTLGPNAVAPGAQPQDIMAQPVNLLATFFEYCSIVTQGVKTQGNKTDAITANVKLCFLILSCIAEDQYANSLIHDANLAFKAQLHRLPMRHRKLQEKVALIQPLAATLLDLLVEFIMTHMMKNFPIELYLQCIGVLQRLLCYQKRCRVRLGYQWRELWAALIHLLKYLTTAESQLAKKMNIFHLAIQIVNILNLFITYGDTFLSSPSSYDELFYEIIRMRAVFTNLNAMALRYSTSEICEFKEHALKLTNCLVNVRDIINHFTPKIDTWLASQSLSTPTEEQILAVVIQNYDSLTLKLQDSLDQYERYSEKPKHTAFFTNMVRGVVIDTRGSIDLSTLDTQAILQEFSSFS